MCIEIDHWVATEIYYSKYFCNQAKVQHRTDITSNIYNINNVITILQLNIQSVKNKLLDSEHVCQMYDVDLICISEHWLTLEKIELFVPQGY